MNLILIIDEYDVKVGYVVIVGKMEDEVIFYLRSRGIILEDV